MKTCQIIILFLFVVGFLATLRVDINGRKAKAPEGFGGTVMTIVLFAAQLIIYYYAGAFSTLLP